MRASGELRTQVVAGAMLYGMDPKTAGMSWRVHTQPANVRMVPTEVSSVAVLSFDFVCVCVCTCTDRLARSSLCMSRCWRASWRTRIDTNMEKHLAKYEPLQRRLDDTLGADGLEDWHSWCTRLCFVSLISHLTMLCPDGLIYNIQLAPDDHFFDSFTPADMSFSSPPV